MKFNLDDFLQLDIKALLVVNGGTHCGGETNSSGYVISSSGNDSYGSHGGGNSGNGGGHSGSGGGGGSCSGSSRGEISTSGGSCSSSSSGGISSGGGSCSGSSGGFTYSPYSFDTGKNTGNTEGISIPDKIKIGNGSLGGDSGGATINMPFNDSTTVKGTVGFGTAGIGVKIDM